MSLAAIIMSADECEALTRHSYEVAKTTLDSVRSQSEGQPLSVEEVTTGTLFMALAVHWWRLYGDPNEPTVPDAVVQSVSGGFLNALQILATDYEPIPLALGKPDA